MFIVGFEQVFVFEQASVINILPAVPFLYTPWKHQKTLKKTLGSIMG